jgi:integrase
MGKRIGLRDIRALPVGVTIWDAAVPSFGARRQKGAVVAYVLKFRTPEGRQRWHTIGRQGSPWTPDMARQEAKRLLGQVAKGADPAAEKGAKRNAATVAQLCDHYWRDAEAGRLLTRRRTAKKPSTLLTDKGRIDRHIKPLLGTRKVASIAREDIERFMHAVAEGETAGRIKTSKKHGLANVRGGRGTASRTTGLLGAIFSYAMRHRMRPDNPVHGVMRFADGRRERRLSEQEYRKLGDALRAAETNVWPAAVAATRFLALTGWRSGEALTLRWSELDLVRRTATLSDTKTGRSIRPLSRAACEAVHRLPWTTGFVFPATRGSGRMLGYPKLWARIARLANLPSDVTPHVLRHSFASLAGDLGLSEPTIAALIGHQGRTMTSRYMHTADAALLAAADAVAERSAELMGEQKSGAVVVRLRQASL